MHNLGFRSMQVAIRKKKNRTTNQHYVPQLYLRRFYNEDGLLHCYDKSNDKSYPTRPKNAASESNFYEFPSGTTKEPMPDNYMEGILSKMEYNFAPQLSNLISAADSGNFTHQQIDDFAPFVVTQLMRTKSYRAEMHERIQKGGQSIVDSVLKLNDLPGKVRIQPNLLCMPAVQAEQMLDEPGTRNLTEILSRRIWTIGINDTASLLYTSDQPVVRNANCYLDGFPLVGVLCRGVEFAYPLDSRHILLILERSYFENMRGLDTKSFNLTPQQINSYNILQVRKCNQRIYCAENDFALAKLTCEQEPAICDPNRPRVKAWSTAMEDIGDKKRFFNIVASLE